MAIKLYGPKVYVGHYIIKITD